MSQDTLFPVETDSQTIEPDLVLFMTKKFAFQALLEKAATVVPSRDIQPMLRNFLVEAEQGQLRVTATDLELSVVAVNELVVVEKPGTCVLPAKQMLSIVHEAEDGNITVEVEKGEAKITVGRASWNLRVADSGEYPPLPAESEIEFCMVDRPRFVATLSAVQYAASRDALKPGYMMIDVNKEKMRAADGIRFQQMNAPGVPDMQIPIGAVGDLLKLLRATEVPKIAIGQDEYQIVFKVGVDMFMAARMTATFPNVDEVLLAPVQLNDQELTCVRSELVSAIRRTRITADEETSAVVLAISQDGVQVSAADKYGSSSVESVDCEWKRADRKASFNCNHLLEMLEHVESKNVTLKFGKDTATHPSAVCIEGPDGARGVLHQLRVE